jgi:hypothetical protein
MDTPDQAAAEKIGRAIDGQIFQLNAERALLISGPARITEIDAELTVLLAEQAKIAPRRPPKPVTTTTKPDKTKP